MMASELVSSSGGLACALWVDCQLQEVRWHATILREELLFASWHYRPQKPPTNRADVNWSLADELIP